LFVTHVAISREHKKTGMSPNFDRDIRGSESFALIDKNPP
jgi:hypothetical protein